MSRPLSPLLLLIACLPAAADSTVVASVTEQYCVGCHGPGPAAAGLNFKQLVQDEPWVRNRETWRRLQDAVESGRMPPKGLPRPSEAELAELLQALDDAIEEFDYSQVDDPGFEPLRRLSHAEYDHTVRDLLGVDVQPTARFTEELTGESGFKNSANTLFLQPVLMERYIAAAERVVEDALPEGERGPAFAAVFSTLPGDGASEDEAARRTLRRFLLRAYRRPPTETEIQLALKHYQQARRRGDSFEAAVKRVVQATLISPHFLMRVEVAPETAEPYRINDWELASRLSYFLWASMPDDELFSLAEQARLHEPDVLRAQIRRLLADPKADTLATAFAGQWLGFEHIGRRVRMGPIDFPWCTETLMDAMRAESSLFFLSLLLENQPIPRLIDADYTFLNQELAETLYGMAGIEGTAMRRVRLDNPNRGGVLGQGSTLAVTSNYNQTSPVKRGHWILDVLLGTPPPPPPPNAGVLKDEIKSQTDLTFREKIALHSSDETCRACHAKMDPLGFSLENFDYFGRWRDDYTFRIRIEDPADPNIDPDSNFRKVVKRIDATGRLPEGAEFDGPAGLKRALLEQRQDDLVRQTASKMLSYALGRQLEYFDEPAIRKILSALEENDLRFQTLLDEIVMSYPFQYKKRP